MKSISALPKIEELLPDVRATVFPEEFGSLFEVKGARLLQDNAGGVWAFRSRDLGELAANPAVGNMPADCSLRLGGYILSDTDKESNKGIQRFFRNLVFTTNPPVHAARREVFSRALISKQALLLVPLAKHLLRDLIAAAIGRDEIDLPAEVCAPLAVRFWGTLFGMTEDEVEAVGSLINAMTPLLLFSRTAEETVTANAATNSYLELVSHAIHRSVRGGASEQLQSMAAKFQAIADTGLSDPIGIVIAANVLQGFHTAAVAGANCAYQLLRSRVAVETVRLDKNLAQRAVVEGLRLSPPLVMTLRYALSELEFADVVIPKGTVIGMLWAAGNRDPDVHNSPNQYDLLRTQRADSTFGGGIHVCPGRYVARMLAEVIVEGITSSDVRINLTSNDPTWLSDSFSRQLRCLPVSLERVRKASWCSGSGGPKIG